MSGPRPSAAITLEELRRDIRRLTYTRLGVLEMESLPAGNAVLLERPESVRAMLGNNEVDKLLILSPTMIESVMEGIDKVPEIEVVFIRPRTRQKVPMNRYW